MGMTLNEGLRSFLPSMGLPEERCGTNRGSQLTPAQRQLYRWILSAFASGKVPSREDVLVAADASRTSVDEALRRMVEIDVIQVSDDGEITCAYPFSATPTGHDVVLDGGTLVHAMCAVDALSIPVLLHRSCVVATSDPLNSTPIRLDVDAAGRVKADPPGAVVVSAVARGAGPLSSLCCPLLNTFASQTTAEQFLASHAELSGVILSLTDASACGAAVFGGVLD
jgi:Alkylmercury lyase